jgi:GNAT superfamily N-acetyltransferase
LSPAEVADDHLLHLLLIQLYQVELPLALDWSPEKARYHLMQMRQLVNQGDVGVHQVDGEEGRPLAIALTSATALPEIMRLHAIFTSPMRRREGLAYHLLDTVRHGREVHAFATRDSLAWHRACGFHVVGAEPMTGLIEMYTGPGTPECHLPFAMPDPTPDDYASIDAPSDPTGPHGPANDDA